MSIEFEWTEEGQGWTGRWVLGDDFGAMGDLLIEPEGGLHGGWSWSNPYCSGSHPDPDEATRRCEASFVAIWESLPEEDDIS